MLLRDFSIERLFGTYSYHFAVGEQQRLFMLTGPNGYGKTTIFSILESLSAGDLCYFYRLPFERIDVGFDDGRSLAIVSVSTTEQDEEEGDEKTTADRRIEFSWYREGGVLLSKLFLDRRNMRKAMRNIGFYKGMNLAFWNFTSDEFGAFARENKRFYKLIAQEQGQEIFLMLLSGFSLTFIEAQRLYTTRKGEQLPTIEAIVEQLQKRMHDDYVRYLQYSQEKDSRFIDAVLTSDAEYDEAEYDRRVAVLRSQIDELCTFGLMNAVKIRPFEQRHARILSAYIDDLAAKVGIYAKTVEKLELFSDLVGRKKFANKEIVFSPDHGFRVKTASGEFLAVNKLSSGEQNEIILLYNIIFEVPDGTLLLVDEPEISLHVAWQQDFVKDMERIAEVKGLQILIATHSPQIIGGRWAECFDLYEHNRTESL